MKQLLVILSAGILCISALNSSNAAAADETDDRACLVTQIQIVQLWTAHNNRQIKGRYFRQQKKILRAQELRYCGE